LLDDTRSEILIELWWFEEVEAVEEILVSTELTSASNAIFGMLHQPLVGLEGCPLVQQAMNTFVKFVASHLATPTPLRVSATKRSIHAALGESTS